jgi:hypothetical protein
MPSAPVVEFNLVLKIVEKPGCKTKYLKLTVLVTNIFSRSKELLLLIYATDP